MYRQPRDVGLPERLFGKYREFSVRYHSKGGSELTSGKFVVSNDLVLQKRFVIVCPGQGFEELQCMVRVVCMMFLCNDMRYVP